MYLDFIKRQGNTMEYSGWSDKWEKPGKTLAKHLI